MHLACSGQLCGTYNSITSTQSIAVFDNSQFPMVATSCEDAFMQTIYPPQSSALIDIQLPGMSPQQTNQVYFEFVLHY